MRFVDDKARNHAPTIQRLQNGADLVRIVELFGRNVQQLDAAVRAHVTQSAVNVRLHGLVVLTGRQKDGLHAQLVERIDLILNQGQQRRNNDGQAWTTPSR